MRAKSTYDNGREHLAIDIFGLTMFFFFVIHYALLDYSRHQKQWFEDLSLKYTRKQSNNLTGVLKKTRTPTRFPVSVQPQDYRCFFSLDADLEETISWFEVLIIKRTVSRSIPQTNPTMPPAVFCKVCQYCHVRRLPQNVHVLWNLLTSYYYSGNVWLK